MDSTSMECLLSMTTLPGASAPWACVALFYRCWTPHPRQPPTRWRATGRSASAPGCRGCARP